MKRAVVPFVVVTASAVAAPAQLPWNDAGGDAWRRELETREQAAAIFPLSPNAILGRVRYGDPKNGVAVLLLDRLPSEGRALLVARDAGCTPRAVLRLTATERGSRTVVCRVVSGEVRPGMEVVLPGGALLERSRTTLPAARAEAAGPVAGPKPKS